jgi:YbbR domain-containing protein
MKLPGFLSNDLGLKLAALLLALFLWVNVAERRPVELVADVPLVFTNMPVGMTFAHKVPATVKARMRGNGRFLRWKAKDIHFEVSLSPAGKGVVTHVLSAAEAVVPRDKGIELLEIVDPKAIMVELDLLSSKEVAVVPTVRGDLASERVLVEGPTVEPAKVMIAGAEHVLAQLSSVPTEPIDANHLARRGRVTVRLDFSDLPPLSSDVELVTVAARAEPRKEIGIPAVPIGVESGHAVNARFSPEAVDMVVSGAASQIDSLDPRSVKLVADLSGIPHGAMVLRPMVREGSLHLEMVPQVRDQEQAEVFDILARVESPYKLEIVSIAPDEIRLVLR